MCHEIGILHQDKWLLSLDLFKVSPGNALSLWSHECGVSSFHFISIKLLAICVANATYMLEGILFQPNISNTGVIGDWSRF